MSNSKDPIKLRKRLTSSGLTSLYLDIYIDGKRSYEYLKLYLVPEKNRADKDKNRTTMRLAEDIKAKRLVELRNGEFGFKSQFKENTLFFPYYLSVAESRKGNETSGNWGNWLSSLHHLKEYAKNEKLRFKDVTPEWIQGYREYLDKRAIARFHDERSKLQRPLSKNSCKTYFSKLKACLKKALEDRIIAYNPILGVEGFKEIERTRMYLTLEELQRLVSVDFPYPAVKKAFLFSCLTGLRRSDIKKLTWGEVRKEGNYTRLFFKQKKTGGIEYLDLNQQAVELMGERGKPEDLVFEDFMSTGSTNDVLKIWMQMAGIDKKITFHCARHTFAILMLDIGTDIYTVSKLLGHRDLSTTQIYAKVLDKNKQAAVSRIPSIFPGKDAEKGETNK